LAVSQTGQRGRTENKDAAKPVSSFSKRDCGVQLLLLFVFLLRSCFWNEFSLYGKTYNDGRIFNSKSHNLAAYLVILPKPFILTYLIHNISNMQNMVRNLNAKIISHFS
jgi:hypothetical protein